MRRRALGAAALLLFLLFEQWGLQVTRTSVTSDRLPEAFDGLRVVQLSDLHGRWFGPSSRFLLAEVRRLEPDLIAVTGDLLDRDSQLPQALALLRSLTEIAPTCFVTGNHEWSLTDVPGVLAAIGDTGATVLENQALLLERSGQRLLLAGVNDPCGPRDQPTPQALGQKLRERYGQDTFFLLLAHRNETPAYWAGTGADLVLAGHAHGGLIRLPGLGGIVARHGQKGYDGGLYAWGETRLYVSRGLGGRGLRLFNRPELALLVLRKS